MYSDYGLGAKYNNRTDGITFHGNGHSSTGSMTDKGVHIYEKSNVKVTDLKISSFSEGIAVLLSHYNIISGIQSFSNRNDGIFLKLK
jgi:nitrous oxidase accessory protein NosD